MAYTFGAEDIIATLGLTATDWEVQDSGSSEQSDTASVKTNNGAYVAAADTRYNIRTELTITLKCKVASTGAINFTMGGAGTDGVVLTNVNVKQVHNDHATVTATAHKHDSSNSHDDSAAFKQAVSITSLGFGVLDVKLGGTIGDCQSTDWTFSMEHTDRLDYKGSFLVGASHGFKVDATEEYLDSGSAITPTGAWKLESQDVRTSNADFYTRSVKAHAYAWS